MSVCLPIFPPLNESHKLTTLELKNGLTVQGYSFGASKAAAGELVFQTGMVGYPESISDPSYEGQILVITFPLVGNYGVPDRKVIDDLVPQLPKYFESNRIHVAGLVVASYTEEYSHYLAKSSLGDWLKEEGIPAIYGVDTRRLTQVIRNGGSTLARICTLDNAVPALQAQWPTNFEVPEWRDPNVENLVARVSKPESTLYQVPESVSVRNKANGKPVRILAVDVGLKYNQIRCFVKRGAELKVVPYNYNFLAELDEFDGLFISNGPGDPAMMSDLVERIRKVLDSKKTPVFGICLGHQLIARAAGASTLKLKFGNRGHNIPATNLISGRCHITSQNHGFAVDTATLPKGWHELFVNANDNSNEGIYHDSLPFFSVQFHPESTPGPRDTEFLFDTFLDTVVDFANTKTLKPVTFQKTTMPPRVDVKKVLVLGSGGLSIGQAGEFDYSGSQAIKALKEEGIYTVLINPNIATIQTSKGLADKVYFLPVNPDFVRKVIKYERPDAIYCTFGGQTALSVGIALKDEFESLGVKVLGTPIDTVITTEDRELFARAMDEIDEKCAKSASANNVEEAVAAANEIGYPLIVRAAYALGGLGSGFADNEKELRDLCAKAFAASPQVLVERSMKGWKEVEYEVVRDAYDNCITVCNMENFDPLGIHTGDSIVVAPSQTLSDEDYNMLRTTAINVIRHLGVVGECNIQYALNPFSKEYCIIEVNARLSRSSALASKATGYPLAFVAAKLGLNIPLNEIQNSVTKSTCACFEPSLDYVVVKIPRWDLKKFTRVSKELSSSMKSVGEVMSIGRTFEEAIQKAIRSTDYHNLGFSETEALMSIDIDTELQTPSDQRLFAIANAFQKGYTVDQVWQLTRIDKWFLNKLHYLIEYARQLTTFAGASIPEQRMREAKQLGFDDRQIAKFIRSNELSVRDMRKKMGITPFVKRIDTVAAEFPAHTNYLYMTYNADTHDIDFDDHGVMVLGSGVYRIGSSVEFDWCAVRAVRTLRQQGTKTIMVNYNPETVSTDYDEADRLYFEVINLERVLDIYELESSSGVVVSMGGQTSNNIALQLHRQNVKILGTSPDMIDRAENRFKFSRMLDSIGVDQPEWKELTSIADAEEFANRVSYPVLVRPSYVLSGAAMNTVYSQDDLENYLKQAVEVSQDYPVVITKYIEGAKEIEMDAVAVNGQMIMHVVSEHVENAGVHSGDATLIVPCQDLAPETVERIVDATAKIGNALNVTGPYNIQFIAKDNEIKVIECNVRASRSFPFVSKVMGVDLIEMATNVIVGNPVEPYPLKDLPQEYVAVKVPQFSFSRLSGADPVLGVEMASTGEVATFGRNKYEAYLKSLIATGIKPPKKNILLSIGSYKEKLELLPTVRRLYENGFNLYATAGTTDFLKEHGVEAKYLELLDDEKEKNEYSLTQYLANNMIDLYVNLPSSNRFRRPASYMSKGYRTRRMAVDYAVPLVTNVKCAKLLFEAVLLQPDFAVSPIDSQLSNTVLQIPGGLVNVGCYVPSYNKPDQIEQVLNTSLANGFLTNVMLPAAEDSALSSSFTLAAARSTLAKIGITDFLLTLAATESNSQQIGTLSQDAGALYMSFHSAQPLKNVSEVSAHFETWNVSKPIVTDGCGANLASVLLLASLYKCAVHVSNVRREEDLKLIQITRVSGLKVTCDVSIISLFISGDQIPAAKEHLPSSADQTALWARLREIDVLSIGHVPAQVCEVLGIPSAVAGIKLAVPLLSAAVRDGHLTAQDIITKMSVNPRKVFGLTELTNASVEIDLDRPCELAEWATIQAAAKDNFRLCGSVDRVEFAGKVVALEGSLVGEQRLGQDAGVSQDMEDRPSVGKALADSRKAIMDSRIKSPMDTSQATAEPSTPVARPEQSRAEARSLSFTDRDRPVLRRELASREVLKDLLRRNPFLRKSVVSVHQFTRRDLHDLFDLAQEMRLVVERKGSLDLLKGRVLATMFYEPSTRTSASFDAAMKRLGGSVVTVTSNTSSVQKGETLQDTLRTLSSYCDAVVLRHPEESSMDIATKYLSVPVLNAGNGPGEHPSQAFLDLFTIREEMGSVNNLTITFMGDLKHGRTVHSLVQLLDHYHIKVQLVCPSGLALPQELLAMLRASNKIKTISEVLTDDILADTDVLYCTRIQKERFADLAEYEEYKNVYRVDNSVLAKCKTHMCIMHPLPRVNEIAEEVDFDHRAAYFRQMRYGLFVRMALLLMVIGVDF
ncbi:Protein URA2 [Wickerhamiella sorbophila]|uniref:Protein URA2 n=1 Tax=Wickerhamiella sorbophila TaxID=45607 RepID=A0A2T0FNF0_9ASCO|nr:Protein URA2 [Wickerhamiella sorbophila]PRT56514.1 Protein URA2 [Wickerhamiella sorbophila]